MKPLRCKRNSLSIGWMVLSLIILVSAARDATAQTNTFPSDGNAGVGTTSPNGGKVQIQSTTAD
ncbi:MAG TPA: hypothetical protein VJT50_17005, partial [Pyrinomonadaceae bacterium]|nr:hypothetical protein [Pyrinomonadaceae bacterium]